MATSDDEETAQNEQNGIASNSNGLQKLMDIEKKKKKKRNETK